MVFCGKGGVGKSTLAVGAALSLARSGRSVLVVSSHPIEELALSFSLAGLREWNPEVASRLYVVHIDPQRVLASIVRSRVRPGRLADMLLASRIYRSFVEVVPALKEFAFLWRLKELASRPPEGSSGRFEHLIWDAPATGHFLGTLEVSEHFEDHFVGPLADQGAEISSFLRTTDLSVIPVCLAEEMSVDEVLDLIGSLAKLALRPSAVLCNAVSPLASRGETPGDAVPVAWAEVGEFIERRGQEERRQYDRLRSLAGAAVLPVRRLQCAEANLDFLIRVSEAIEGAGLTGWAGTSDGK